MQRHERQPAPFRREGGGFRPDRGGFDRGGFRGRPQSFGPRGQGPAIDYKGLVEFVAKTMADEPDAVQVQAFERHRGAITLKIGMAEKDLGKLIGRGGRNIEALRTLVRVAALRERRKVFVDLA